MLYAATDASDPDHSVTRDLLTGWGGELVVSAFTATEADHLILSRLGMHAELAFLADLGGTYLVDSLDGPGILEAREICARYRDLEIGLADASIVVLAAKWGTHSIGSFDDRHFRAMVPADGRPFRLLPSDL